MANSRTWILGGCLAMVLAHYTAAQEQGKLTLVRDGRAACVIAVSPAADTTTNAVAAEFQSYLARICEVPIALKQSNSLSSQDLAGALILIGESDLTRQAGVDIRQLPPEGFVIRTAGRMLILAGRDDPLDRDQHQHGTSFAVVTFLEDYLGMRWLWPGALGEVVPARKSLVLDPIDRREAPVLRQRKIRDSMSSENPKKVGRGRLLMDMDVDELARMRDQSSSWLLHLKTGESVRLHYQHAFRDWWDKYHNEHPDFFAQQLNGSRQWPSALGQPDRAKICVSNPQVLDKFLDEATSFFQDQPNFQSFSASPNDNSYGGHCMCSKCRAWDAGEASKVELRSVDSQGNRILFNAPAMTDRYLHFYNLAAARLAKQWPAKLIAGYAYGASRTPPVREKVNDNVLISFVGFNSLRDGPWQEDLDLWDGWARLTKQLMLRPNLLHDGHGYPLVYVHRLGETLRHCQRSGMIAADFDALEHHWASQGLNYYVLAKLLWNPAADVDAMVDDYCRSGFGKAAPAIREYFRALEEHTDRLATRIKGKNQDFAAAAFSFYSTDTLNAWQQRLDEANRLAADDRIVRQRIEFLNQGIHYARIQTAALQQNPGAKTLRIRGKSTHDERQQFYYDHRYSFAIGVPALVYSEATRGEAQ
ncbi:MAG: DUF4838 domain-containing protein [Planctomycetia bacterium]|nr:DUF4838 domain-containing protein [Planctomycetia bacterium]